jgi:hypothetical protein
MRAAKNRGIFMLKEKIHQKLLTAFIVAASISVGASVGAGAELRPALSASTAQAGEPGTDDSQWG